MHIPQGTLYILTFLFLSFLTLFSFSYLIWPFLIFSVLSLSFFTLYSFSNLFFGLVCFFFASFPNIFLPFFLIYFDRCIWPKQTFSNRFRPFLFCIRRKLTLSDVNFQDRRSEMEFLSESSRCFLPSFRWSLYRGRRRWVGSIRYPGKLIKGIVHRFGLIC